MWGEYLLLWKISIALLSMWKVQNIGKNIFEVAGHPNWNFALVFRHSCSSQSSSTVWLCHGCCRPSLLLPLNAPWSCILCTVSILTPPPLHTSGIKPIAGAAPCFARSSRLVPTLLGRGEHKAQLSHCCRCNPASILYQHFFFFSFHGLFTSPRLWKYYFLLSKRWPCLSYQQTRHHLWKCLRRGCTFNFLSVCRICHEKTNSVKYMKIYKKCEKSQ